MHAAPTLVVLKNAVKGWKKFEETGERCLLI